MDLTNIRDRIQHVADHKDCLDQKAQEFIADCVENFTRKGELGYFTVKQQRYFTFCWRQVCEKYPVEEIKMSGLQRMREAREALKRRIAATGKRNAANRENPLRAKHGGATFTVAKSTQALLGDEITARPRHGKTLQKTTRSWISTMRDQKPHGGKS